MELTQHSLMEELIPKLDSSFPPEFLQNTWNFAPFDQTPDFHPPLANPSFLDLISPPEFPNPCPFGEFQPFLDALTSPEFYERDDLPPMSSIQPDYAENGESLFLDGFSGGFDGGTGCLKVEDAQIDAANGVVYNNVGLYGERKSKSKKPEGQPSKNLMAERRRRKRLNDRLSMLRSIVPKISKMDRTSILGDTIDYMRELLDKIEKVREQGEDGSTAIRDYFKEHQMQLRNPPKFEVERKSEDTRIEVCCTAKPGLLLSTLTTLDAIGLDLQHCVISCFNDFSLQASCYEGAEQRATVSAEDVKQALFRNAGYGGRCL